MCQINATFVTNVIYQTMAYGNLRLPTEVIEEFKDWAAAYRLTYGKDLTNGEVLEKMFASVEAGDPAVHECYAEALERRGKLNQEDNG